VRGLHGIDGGGGEPGPFSAPSSLVRCGALGEGEVEEKEGELVQGEEFDTENEGDEEEVRGRSTAAALSC